MLHIALHGVLPVLAALAFYRPQWRSAALILLATMAVDVDHLLANPVYDPARCSLGFHPLHTVPAVALYAVLFTAPLVWARRHVDRRRWGEPLRVVHLVGLGLLVHMALDGADCLL